MPTLHRPKNILALAHHPIQILPNPLLPHDPIILATNDNQPLPLLLQNPTSLPPNIPLPHDRPMQQRRSKTPRVPSMLLILPPDQPVKLPLPLPTPLHAQNAREHPVQLIISLPTSTHSVFKIHVDARQRPDHARGRQQRHRAHEVRERRDEVHGDAAAEGEADDAERLGAPRERRGGSREEDLQGEQGAGVGDEGRVGVAAAPEVCWLVKKKRLVG